MGLPAKFHLLNYWDLSEAILLVIEVDTVMIRYILLVFWE